MSREEELELLIKVKAKMRDEDAFNRLLKDNHGLVVGAVNKFNPYLSGHPDEREEMIAVGDTALKESIMKFDITRGNRLSTYAFWGINGAVIDSYRNSRYGGMSIPRELLGLKAAIKEVQNLLFKYDQPKPTRKELADRFNKPLEEIEEALMLLGLDFVPIDSGNPDDPDDKALDLPSLCQTPDEELDGELDVKRLRDAIAELPPKDCEIIIRHCDQGESLEDISKDKKEIPATVRQRHKRAVEKLRTILSNEEEQEGEDK